MSSIIRYYYNFYVYYFSVFVATGLILPISLFRPKNVHNAKLISYVVQFLSKILIKDVSFSLRNREILDNAEAAVIVANHQSSLDILGLFMTWHIFDKLSVVAKKVLFYFWPFGLCAYFSGIIFIDREKTKDAYKQLKVIAELMVTKKIKVLLYAEGTRNTSGKGIMPFKKGAFKMAVSAQVPIIPMVYSPYYFIKPDQRLFYQGNVIMECLDPVPTAGLTMEDIPKLAEQVRQKMLVAYERLSKEVTST